MMRLFWDWYWRRKINYRLNHGLCLECGRPAFPLLTRCPAHLERMAREHKARIEKMKGAHDDQQGAETA